ncbi:MAG TPA: hypothetical protein VEM39_11970, partial [Myxococcaceae bacterium]|nr:hypothetical protein [Myxococcaceae bacterium]
HPFRLKKTAVPAMRPTDSAEDSRSSDALRFRATLRKLNARSALALRLRIVQGLSRSECAAFLGISQSAFDVLFLRAVRELRGRLESSADDGGRLRGNPSPAMPRGSESYAEEVEQAEHLAASIDDGSKRPGDRLAASMEDGSKRPGDRLLASIDHGSKRPGDRLAASMEDGSALPGASLATSIADSSTSRGENAASTDPGSTLRGDLGAPLVLVRRLQAIAPEIRAQDSAALREEETSPGLRRRNLLWRALLLAIVVTGLFLYLKPRPPPRVISRVPQEDLR